MRVRNAAKHIRRELENYQRCIHTAQKYTVARTRGHVQTTMQTICSKTALAMPKARAGSEGNFVVLLFVYHSTTHQHTGYHGRIAQEHSYQELKG